MNGALAKVGDIVWLGLHSLYVNLVRSFLSALCIIFAVFGVIAMLAMNKGASLESQRLIRELGSNNVILNSVKSATSGAGSAGQDEGFVLAYGLKHADVRRLRSNIPGIQRVVTVNKTLKQGYANARKINVDVIGTEPSYFEIANLRLLHGRFISHADMIRRKAFCVITRAMAREFFGFEDPIGKTVLLHTEPFTVIGVLAKVPESLADQAGQFVAFIPNSTNRARFGPVILMFEQGSETREYVEVSQMIFQLGTETEVMHAADIARSLLDRHHEEADYQVRVPLELIEQQEKQQWLWNFMLIAIASVSLIVGGIGIMNIMLAAVTERTREIGIRRALGAKRADITIQFLTEAVALTTVGGLIGIAIGGVAVPFAVKWLVNIQAVVTGWSLVLPFLMAVLVGLASGVYPAMRAAQLDPIVALRHE